ncbi:hypothetical protein GCM10007425_04080 [Lysinibacillus alkalisoli]|uniref:SLH domain-containing protein n=1 Tax=Lysinibacillus alkalisoli TaxID=1911548 RepID=A0A917D7C3_9BACI|nr:S-layer homology domain-containing protein [Lysinibacillus alkalisoli]GGG12944.1 hypothetical protein GCM10007425_04080 [Lysinibacillus alkalisoli]
MNQSKWFKGAVVLSLTTSAIVVPMQAQAAGFSDVDANSESGKAIQGLVDRGIIRGYSDGTFKPNQHVTRAQAASILGKVLQLDTTNIKNPEFKDVGTWHQNYKEIAALAQAGIMPGYANGEFKLYRAITREEMAEILVRAFHLKAPNKVEMPFDDVRVGSELYDLVEALYALNVTKGASATKFGPNDVVTRSQFALFITRAEAVKGKPVDPIDPDPVDPVDPDPIDPVDPVDPDPVDPVDPIDPEPTEKDSYTIKASQYGLKELTVINSDQAKAIVKVTQSATGIQLDAIEDGTGYVVIGDEENRYYIDVTVKDNTLEVKDITLLGAYQPSYQINADAITHAIDKVNVEENGLVLQPNYYTIDNHNVDIKKSGDYILRVSSYRGFSTLLGLSVKNSNGKLAYKSLEEVNEETLQLENLSKNKVKDITVHALDNTKLNYTENNGTMKIDVKNSDKGFYVIEVETVKGSVTKVAVEIHDLYAYKSISTTVLK